MSFSWDGARKGKKNPFFGRKHSVATRKKMSLAAEGKKNMMWKGNAVGYHALHDWVKRRLPKPKLCQDCENRPPRDLANISQKYLRKLSDWKWLCRKCHMIQDGRTKSV